MNLKIFPLPLFMALMWITAFKKQIVDAMKLNQSTLPVFIIADTFNRVVFVSQGYTIGLGEQLMKVVHGL